MSEEKKLTGLAHDDDGNVDDRRVAGWIIIVVALVMSLADILPAFEANPNIVDGLIYAGVFLLATTVAEKFARKL